MVLCEGININNSFHTSFEFGAHKPEVGLLGYS